MHPKVTTLLPGFQANFQNPARSGRILISDDEPLMVAVLRRQLERRGFQCLSDTSSARVLELARSQQPDLIILDMQQPTDGRDLLGRLKKDPATRGLKVLVLSAVDDAYVRQTCLELGAADYELKPFDPRFFDKVSRLAGRLPAAAASN